MSFAGQQETYLNMHGQAMVLDAVKRCWASLWTARASDYRARHNIAPQDVSMARLWQGLGRHDEARELLSGIYGCFTEGFETPDVQEARALPEQLKRFGRSRPRRALIRK